MKFVKVKNIIIVSKNRLIKTKYIIIIPKNMLV